MSLLGYEICTSLFLPTAHGSYGQMEQANPGGEKRANFQKWSLYSWKKMKNPGTIEMTDFRQRLRPKVLTRHLD